MAEYCRYKVFLSVQTSTGHPIRSRLVNHGGFHSADDLEGDSECHGCAWEDRSRRCENSLGMTGDEVCIMEVLFSFLLYCSQVRLGNSTPLSSLQLLPISIVCSSVSNPIPNMFPCLDNFEV